MKKLDPFRFREDVDLPDLSQRKTHSLGRYACLGNMYVRKAETPVKYQGSLWFGHIYKFFRLMAALFLVISTQMPLLSQCPAPGPFDIPNPLSDPACDVGPDDCTSKDLEIVGAFLVVDDGGCNVCIPGETLTAELFLSIINKTGSTRTAFAIFGTLAVTDENGMITSCAISRCSGPIPPNSTSTVSYGNVTYTCGDQLKLIDVIVSWTDASPNSDCASYDCKAIAPKCGQTAEILITPPLQALAVATCATGAAIDVDLTVQGGTAPFLYSWTGPGGFTATTQDLAGVATGAYGVTITDSKGCTVATSVTLEVCCVAPVITCPPHIVVSCGASTDPLDTGTASYLEGCGEVSVTFTDDGSGLTECTGTGILIRTWTATDATPSAVSCTQIITIRDLQPPQFTEKLPGDLTVNCAAVPPPASPEATDNCDEEVTITFKEMRTDGSCPAGYTLTRTWTATDDCGNSTTQRQVITVQDTKAPVFDKQPDPIEAINCEDLFPAPEDITASDVCSGATIAFSIDPYVVDPVNGYEVVYRWVATDGCENTSQVTSSFRVLPDTEGPVFTKEPADIPDIACNEPHPKPEVLWAKDYCSDAVVFWECEPYEADVCNGYDVTYRWTALDALGNANIVRKTFHVRADAQAPVFDEMPSPIADISCRDPFPTPEYLTATDDCGRANVRFSIDPFEKDMCNGYEVTYRWTAVDGCDNQMEVTQSFRVLPDREPPRFENLPTCLPELTCNELPQAPGDIKAKDDCSDVTLSFVIDPYEVDMVNGYRVTYRWTATDACGNSSEALICYAIRPDEEPPGAVEEPAELEDIPCDGEFPPVEEVQGLDNCGGAVEVMFSIDDYTIDVCEGYVVTYRWTLKDEAGNTADITRSFNVLPDREGPVFDKLPADIPPVNCDHPHVEPEILTAKDNCSEVSVAWECEPYVPDVCAGYRIVYRWTASDGCGNQTVLRKSFQVLPDTEAPQFAGLPDPLPDLAFGTPFPQPQTLTAEDNCSGDRVVFSIDPYEMDECDPYPVTYRWTTKDGCGNAREVIRSFRMMPAAEDLFPDWDQQVGCLQEIPCPDRDAVLFNNLIDSLTRIFSSACGPVTVTLDAISPLQTCADPDGDGISTFEQTFYFKIVNAGGVELPNSPRSVRFYGECGYCTFTQSFWGNDWGYYPDQAPDNFTAAIIQSLIREKGAIVIGRPGASLRVNTAACVLTLLPGSGSGGRLAFGDVTADLPNCAAGGNALSSSGRLRNSLATNAIALTLNIWYNEVRNSSGFGQRLLAGGCPELPQSVLSLLNDPDRPYTVDVQGLLDLANDYLGGVYGTNSSLAGDLTKAVAAVNEYWDKCREPGLENRGPCSAGALVPGAASKDIDYRAGYFEIYPNPASNEVEIRFVAENKGQTEIKLYTANGELIHSYDHLVLPGLNRKKIETHHFSPGVYWVNMQVDKRILTGRFIKIDQ